MTRRPQLMFGVVTGVNRDLRLRILVAVFCSCTATSPLLAQAPPSANTSVKAPTWIKWGNIPLSFEPNMGQESPEVRYLARGSSFTLYLADAEMLLSGHNQTPLKMKLLGANRAPRIVGESDQVSTSNYLVGNDPSKWRTSVPNYGRARYRSVYPGIDLVYYGHDGNLEYDWIVSPSADPRRIRLRFDSADRLRVDKQGDLVIELGQTEYRHKKPVVYQDIGGKRIEIAGTWLLRGKEAGFRIGRYDRDQPLIIDPVLYYSTYLGGSGLDYANAIAVDGVGNTYVTGGTGSANFPTANPLQGSLRGSVDVFVTKINASGSAKLYSTFLGSTGVDEGKGIAVDNGGDVYVTGSAGFSDFPTMNAIQGTWGGSGDAFLTKLNATGTALVYSTYLGGNSTDSGTAVALDPAGNAYVAGVTFSTNFPTVNPFQAVKGAQQDAFVAKINPSGSAWVYATYLGGNNVDEGYGIAADTAGNAYVTGYTASTNFPVQSPFQGSNAGSVDAFVTKLNPVGSALVYSTYLGGSATDYGTAIAVDSSGSAYVTGIVTSEDFPLAHPIDATLGSHAVDDVFVTKFSPSGSGLVYSTYLGGASADDGYAIALDRAGNAFITGRTNSSDFPLVNPIQQARIAFDMFVTEINAAGSALLFSTFVGGSASESGRGIAVDSLGNIHIAGESTSTDFPVVKAVQTGSGGFQDAVVLLFATRLPATGDFDGNAKGDLMLRNKSTGQNIGWLMNGLTVSTSAFMPTIASTNWEVRGRGDFDGDGKADVILRNKSTGQNIGWLMNGLTVSTSAFMPTIADTNWEIKGVGDFDGDGKADVILRNKSTGQNIGWLMNGLTVTTSAFMPTIADTNWEIVGVGDFDGDGKADVILRNKSTGQNIGWLMNGLTVSTAAFLPAIADTNWEIKGVGDFDGDGKADVILRNKSTGQDIGWLMNGLSVSTAAFLPTIADTNWEIKGVGDFDGDGKADVILRNKSTGQNIGWLMNGLAVSTSAFVPTIVDTNWEFVGQGQ